MVEDTDGDFPGTERFAVLGRIGAGGMGVVYEVQDGESGRRVLSILMKFDWSRTGCTTKRNMMRS